ncbi:MAG: LptE family protein [Candidatus Omnitrophica bacterium]|nr:LptE family protein [Candidatus Omnitrophota bacterium]
MNLLKLIGGFLSLALILILAGCGYSTNAFFLPLSIRSVYIETFQNKTDQPNIENDLRARLISTFQSDGSLKIATRDEADAVLSGEVIGYSRQALRYSSDEHIEEYRLNVTVNFLFTAVENKEVIVKADSFTGETSFFLTGSSAKSEITARSDALEDLSRRILNKTITLW